MSGRTSRAGASGMLSGATATGSGSEATGSGVAIGAATAIGSGAGVALGVTVIGGRAGGFGAIGGGGGGATGATTRGLACMGANAGALRSDADGLAAALILDAPEDAGRGDVAAA